MGRSAKKCKTSFDWSEDDGMVHICTHADEVMRVLAKHPQVRLVEVNIDQDCKVTSGEWELPFKAFRIILTGGGSEFTFYYE